jgi:hypothetical protein
MMQTSVQPPERLPFKVFTSHERGGSHPPRSPAAGGRNGGDGARQWTEAARARETRGKGVVDLDLLRGKGVFDSEVTLGG